MRDTSPRPISLPLPTSSSSPWVFSTVAMVEAFWKYHQTLWNDPLFAQMLLICVQRWATKTSYCKFTMWSTNQWCIASSECSWRPYFHVHTSCSGKQLGIANKTKSQQILLPTRNDKLLQWIESSIHWCTITWYHSGLVCESYPQ